MSKHVVVPGTRNNRERLITHHRAPPNALQILSLLATITIMLVGAIYPLVFSNPNGTANHRIAFVMFWAMGAGMVRGVGFIPRTQIWRLLFSGWTCFFALVVAIWLRWA